ncbi:MAG: hypothetical protein ACPG4N_03445 [Gammaproteobacteria bacterium]
MMKTQIAILALCSLLGINTQAAVLYSDDYNAGTTNGLIFSGNDAGQWAASGGVLNSSSGSDDAYEARGYAFFDGISTSDHFRLTADISAIRTNNRPNGTTNFGHLGFVWDYNDDTHLNLSYARVHSDHVTTFSIDGGGSGELQYSTGSLSNNNFYTMILEVDYVNQLMDISFNGVSTSYSGATFSNYLYNNGVNTGGNIGLMTFGEEIHFDNVSYEDFTVADAQVPAPVPGLLMLVSMFGLRRFRSSFRSSTSTNRRISTSQSHTNSETNPAGHQPMTNSAHKLLASALLLGTSLTANAALFTVTQSADLSGLDTSSQPNRVDLFDLNLTGLDPNAIGDATLTLSIDGDFNSACYLSGLGFGGSTNGECLYGTIEGLGGEFRLTDGNTSDNGPFDGGSTGNDTYVSGISTYTANITLAALLPIISDGVMNMSFDRGGNVNGVNAFSSTISYEIADAEASIPGPAPLALLALGLTALIRRGGLSV